MKTLHHLTTVQNYGAGKYRVVVEDRRDNGMYRSEFWVQRHDRTSWWIQEQGKPEYTGWWNDGLWTAVRSVERECGHKDQPTPVTIPNPETPERKYTVTELESGEQTKWWGRWAAIEWLLHLRSQGTACVIDDPDGCLVPRSEIVEAINEVLTATD